MGAHQGHNLSAAERDAVFSRLSRSCPVQLRVPSPVDGVSGQEGQAGQDNGCGLSMVWVLHVTELEVRLLSLSLGCLMQGLTLPHSYQLLSWLDTKVTKGASHGLLQKLAIRKQGTE